MGRVYLGYDERLERPVALKQVRAEAAGPKARERFRWEARAIARLSHPAIVQVYDFVETPEGDWIVMEMVEGRSLRDEMRSGPLAPERVLLLARQIAGALAAAHDAGIVHRDLKPENVMVTADGLAKVLDFGLAKSWQEESLSLTLHGAVVGTVAAMSPEQALGHPVDRRSDLFSLGSMLYEMLTGVAAFRGRDRTEIVERICRHRQVPVRDEVPEAPPALSDLVDRLLEKSPSRRPQDAREVIAEIDSVAREMNLGWSVGDWHWEPPAGTAERSPTPPSHSGLPLSSADGWTSRLSATRTDVALQSVLLTDLVGSTDLVAQLGDDRAADVLAHHDRAARDLLARFGGREIDKSDGFLLLFERPRNAVEWALAYHDELARLSEERGVKLEARVGLHVGEVFLRENSPDDVARGAKPIEVEGLAKPTAARVMSLARGGQTLLTRSAFDLAQRALTPEPGDRDDLVWLRHGVYELQGVGRLGIFEVGRPGVAPLKAPSSAKKARRVRRGLYAAVALGITLAAAAAVLVRDVAAPPVRPAVAVLGFENLSGRSELDWLGTALTEFLAVELGSGGQLRLIPGAHVADAALDLDLAGSESYDESALAAIRRHLGTDYVVAGSYLVLDTDGARELSIQPTLRSAATGEVLAAVRETGSESDLVSLVSQAGIRLRDKLSVAGSSPDEQHNRTANVEANLSTNRQAARLYFEGLRQLRLRDANGARELLEKAVALDPDYGVAHAALSEAWDALGYDARKQESARRAFELRDGLSREEALLIEGRYHSAMYRREEAAAVYEALWRFYPDDVDYALKLAEAQNDRSAFETLETLRQLPPPLGDDPRIDLTEARIAFRLSDSRRQLAAAERAAAGAREIGATTVYAQSLSYVGIALDVLGDYPKAEAAFQESRRLMEQVHHLDGAASVLNNHASLLQDRGALSRAEELFREALAIDRETGNRSGTATVLFNLGTIAYSQGDLDEAQALVEESLEIAFEISDRRREAYRYFKLGRIALARGELASSRSFLDQAVRLSREIEYRRVLAESLNTTAELLLVRGELDQARRFFDEARETAEEIGYKNLSWRVLDGLARWHLVRDEPDAAAERLDAAKAIRDELGGDPAQIQLTRAHLHRQLGQPLEAEWAAREAIRTFEQQGRRDQVLLALAAVADALVDQGKLAETGELADRLSARAPASQNPAVRLRAALTLARVDAAAGRFAAAVGDLQRARDSAVELGLRQLEAEARRLLAELNPGG